MTEIVLFHYSYSPFARRVSWYLQLRKIKYSQCVQPPILPRGDLASLGIKYRRIPLMAIGRDVYCDTRLILKKLEELYPDGALGATQDDQKTIERLLEKFTVDNVFNRAAQLIPPDSAVMQDPKFINDRKQFSGRDWSPESQAKGRPEALVHVRDAFELFENTILADGRKWVLKTNEPSLADIEGIWPFHWVITLKGALDPQYISKQRFPKVFAWVERFEGVLKATRYKAPTVKGPEAFKIITSSNFAEEGGAVDPEDPLGLKLGDTVEFYPIESGFRNRDQGQLVSLTAQEVIIAVRPPEAEKDIHLHAPRWGFRVQRSKGGSVKI